MPMRVATMSELMVKIIYPTSDAVFYISTREPKNEVEWGELQNKTLALAESGALILEMSSRHATLEDLFFKLTEGEEADAAKRERALESAA